MIDVRDLQVGSYVQDPDGMVVMIREINPVAITYQASSQKFATMEVLTSIEDLRPITITIGWLKNLGITMRVGKNNYCHPYPANNWVVELDENSCQLWNGEWHKPIDHIHQLQALIWHTEGFWLTLPETP